MSTNPAAQQVQASANVSKTNPLVSVDEVDDWKRDLLGVKSSKPSADPAVEAKMKAQEDSFNPIDETKKKESFRNYENSARQERVQRFYQQQHSSMTYAYVGQMEEKYLPMKLFKMSVWDALEYLNQVVDDSDPDTNLTQIQHALQTAEACRRKFPQHDWFHLTGLIHDLGKIIAVRDDKIGILGEPQWAVVGDTFPVGCPFSPKNVFAKAFESNPDFSNALYNSGTGVYPKGCGLEKVKMSWGHDEYLYRVMVHNKCTLPLPALYMIRYHSFYPWHKEGAYQELLNDQDREMLPWIKAFNECDLYSKSHVPPNVDELAPYYKSLIDKYCPGALEW
jgi:inositol oxygenase